MLNNDAKLTKSYQNLSLNFGIGMAGTSKASGYEDGSSKKKIMEVASLAYYQMAKEKRMHQVEMYKACPDLDTAIKFFGLMEKDVQTKFFVEKTFPKVTF